MLQSSTDPDFLFYRAEADFANLDFSIPQQSFWGKWRKNVEPRVGAEPKRTAWLRYTDFEIGIVTIVFLLAS